jgi:hypothetical protein
VGSTYFINYFLNNSNSNMNFWHFNPNTVYILRDGNYADIKFLFTSIDNTPASIVRGRGQKHHAISPMEVRLSTYLIILCNMNFTKVNKENKFNSMTKERYLPSY